VALVAAVVWGHWFFLTKVSPWVQTGAAGEGPAKAAAAPSTWQLVAVPVAPAPRPAPAASAAAHAAKTAETTLGPARSQPVNPEPVVEKHPPETDTSHPEAAPVEASSVVAEPAPAVPSASESVSAPEEASADPFEADLQQQSHWPTAVPSSADLRYTVNGHYSGFPLIASAAIHWNNQGDHYQAQGEISLLGFKAVQNSQGLLGAQGLMPVRFSDKRRSEIAAHFNAEKRQITYSANTPDAVLRLLQQDQLSVFIQLAAWVAADPAHFPVGTHITVPVSSARGPDFWLFSVDGPEVLALANHRSMSTLKLHRLLQKETDTAGEVWLSPDLQYLPARIKLTDAKGNVVDQTLEL
jgi:hypothetical protein